MQTTYLNKFIDYSKNKTAYIPIGTLEWHGNHLPIETDFLVAQRICEIMARKIPGYILPPIFLGSGTKKKVKGKWLIGMDKFLNKKLSGNLYYLEPDFFAQIIVNLSQNLKAQGFEKITVITGHSGAGQKGALKLAQRKIRDLIIIDPYEILAKHGIEIEHADENETALFWACYPEEEAVSRKIKIGENDDYFRFLGHDPRLKASLRLGKKLLNLITQDIVA